MQFSNSSRFLNTPENMALMMMGITFKPRW